MQSYEHQIIRVTFRAGGTSTINFINDEAVGSKHIPFYPYLKKLGDDGWEIIALEGDIFVLKRIKEQLTIRKVASIGATVIIIIAILILLFQPDTAGG